MAILAFQKPDKVIMLEADSKYGKFEFRPLEPGFGITIGNALRRILLSSLEGYAINTVKIEGVEHEFATVPGVKEDVTNIILNLKQVRFKQIVEEVETEKVTITVENATEFKAGDITKCLSGFEVLNPELVICHLDSKATMQIELSINKGRGYVPSEENRVFCTEVNTIPVDSIYTPIRNVKYAIEQYRVEQKTDYDKLVLEIATDGSIHPKDALKEAAKILIHHFMLFSDEKITLEDTAFDANEEFDEEVLHMRQLLKTKLTDMNLSVRALNCLKAAEVETLVELYELTKCLYLGSLQAVERTNREVHIGQLGLEQLTHVEYLLIKLLVCIECSVLKSNLLVREQHEVMDKDLGSLLEGIFRVDGTIGSNLKYELIVVGLLLNTILLNSVLDITYRGVDRVNGDGVDVCAEHTVLLRRNITTTLVDRQLYLHCSLGV